MRDKFWWNKPCNDQPPCKSSDRPSAAPHLARKITTIQRIFLERTWVLQKLVWKCERDARKSDKTLRRWGQVESNSEQRKKQIREGSKCRESIEICIYKFEKDPRRFFCHNSHRRVCSEVQVASKPGHQKCHIQRHEPVSLTFKKNQTPREGALQFPQAVSIRASKIIETLA